MKYNLRGEERKGKGEKVRDEAEHKLFSFLRYFVPAIGPLLLYLLTEGLMVIIGSTIVDPMLSHEQFRQQRMNLYMILGVIVTFFVLKKYSKKHGSGFFEDASLYRKDLSIVKSIGAVIFGLGASLAISAFLSLLPPVGPVAVYDAHIERIYQTWSVYLGVLFNTFFTPLVEEVVFRGYMLNRLLPHWGEKAALIAVSAAFALLHGTSIWILYAFFMGWIIGKVSIIEDNIFYAVLMHIGFNLLSSILWYIYLFYPGSQEALSANKPLELALGIIGASAALFVAKAYKLERESMFVTRFFHG
ncbi:lysostaphin resistance A-like protein [Lachnospiraceae bacterium C1.1]|nr:CPBP family intramembrane metalloprotease [Lachnospiraceae bacterium C1.1]